MIPLTAKGLVEKGLVQVCDQAKVPEPCESSANMSMEKFLSGLGEVYKKYLPAFNLHGMKRPKDLISHLKALGEENLKASLAA